MLSHSYYDVWFIVSLLRRGVVHRFITTLYLYESDLDIQSRFDQSKISNYDYQYVEKLKS